MITMTEFLGELKEAPRRCYVVVGSKPLLDNFLAQTERRVETFEKVDDAYMVYFREPVVRVIVDDTSIDLKYAEELKNGIKGDIMIYWYPQLSKESKIRKMMDSCLVEIEANTESLKGYASRELEKTPVSFISALVDLCGDYDRLAIEVNKIKALSKAKGLTTKEAIIELEKSGNLVDWREQTAQELAETMFNGKWADFFAELSDFKSKREYGYAHEVLNTLYGFARKVLLVKRCKQTGIDATKATSLNKGQVYYYGKFLDKFTSTELLDLLDILYMYTEHSVKGYYDEDVIVEMAITDFIGGLE